MKETLKVNVHKLSLLSLSCNTNSCEWFIFKRLWIVESLTYRLHVFLWNAPLWMMPAFCWSCPEMESLSHGFKYQNQELN